MAKARIWGFGKAAAAGGRESGVSPGPRTGGQDGAGAQASGDDPAKALMLLRTFEESGQGWFWSTDPDGHLTYISASIAETLNAGDQSVIGCRFTNLFAQADPDPTGRRGLPFILAKQSAFDRIMARVAQGDDERCWCVSGAPQHDGAGRFTGYKGSAIDVTEQRRSSAHAAQLAKYDALTGLPNRRRMSEILDAALIRTEHHKKPCAVLLIDLDRFKQVNDTLGHLAGDALLKQVAERLTLIAGDREQVFRLGGDEFQVILPDCGDREIVSDMAGAIVASLSQPYLAEGSRCSIGASLGVAIAPGDGSSRAELMRNADLALYAVKSAGRGRFRFFSTDLLKAAEDKRTLEEDLRDALVRGEISLAYQPIVNAVTNRITGVEALLRWQHPRRGAISPAKFIPIAEEAGLIPRLGEWALRRACADAASWSEPIRVAVNVSPIQFSEEALSKVVTSALAASGLSPERLELEITEGVFLDDSPSTDTMFATLKNIGVRLVLDDFGTGYSSLGYLRTAPFDKIKIDQTFVRAATLPESRNSAIIAAIVALAEALDMETTAEGIEFMDQLDLVRSLRVSHVQGWVYGKAMAGEELDRRLRAGDWVIKPSGPARQRSERKSTYRKVGVIHGHRYQSAIMRDLSESGALIDRIRELPLQSRIVVDFGSGHFTFARITRATGRHHGVAFEEDLVDDGDGGLCPRHRVSPYQLATMGLPSPGDPDKNLGDDGRPDALEELAARLGLPAPPPRPPAAPTGRPSSAGGEESRPAPTFREVAKRYLESLQDDVQSRESAGRDLRNHVLPRFGPLQIDALREPDMLAWLAGREEEGALPPGTSGRLGPLLGRVWATAAELARGPQPAGRGRGECPLGEEDALKLLRSAATSYNRQLPFILALVMTTGARLGETLNAQWRQFDLEAGVWRIDDPARGDVRELRLSRAAVAVLGELPREESAYLVPNPITRKPYRSIARSWEVARDTAGLPYLEIDELRHPDFGTDAWEELLLPILRGEASGPEAESVVPHAGPAPLT